MENINIEQKTVKVVSRIEIDGKMYPLTPRNMDCASDYLRTKDERFLEHLTDFSLDI